MILYRRSAFGLNLIFRVHGSAVYRSVFPSLVAVGVFLLIRYRDTDAYEGERRNDQVGHPYALGVLVGSTTFLLVFRANQGYARYWEAVTSIHHMMSKWMDACSHMAIYHLQCAHYDDIKPPSYFEYPELDAMNLTRDRERGWEQPEPSERITPRIPVPSTRLPLVRESSMEVDATIGNPRRRQGSSSIDGKPTNTLKERQHIHSAKVIRSVNKSINTVTASRKEKAMKSTEKFGQSHFTTDEEALDNFFASDTGFAGPAPLLGTPKLDGNWGALFNDNKATFCDPQNPRNFDSKGFASEAGGRTPPLFLQELAHLCSLMTAVALATLRNDTDGVESPLDFHEPGSDWPEVDPDKDEALQVSGIQACCRIFLGFFGVARTPDERMRYTVARPLPVIGGVSDSEIQFLQMAKGPWAKTQLCWQWFSEFCIREHLAGSTGKVGPPIISRVIQFLGDGMIYYNHARKVRFIPFPFAHAQISVLFVWMIIPVVGLLMDQYTNDTWLGSILTFGVITCLAGIDEVARELESPFRNVPNEIPLVTFMAQFNEALITMYAGYHPDHYWDGARALKEGRETMQRQRTNRNVAAAAAAAKPDSKPQTFGGQSVAPTMTENEEMVRMRKQLEDQGKIIQQLVAKLNGSANATGSKDDEDTESVAA